MKTLKDNLTGRQSFEKVAFYLSTVLGLGIEEKLISSLLMSNNPIGDMLCVMLDGLLGSGVLIENEENLIQWNKERV